MKQGCFEKRALDRNLFFYRSRRVERFCVPQMSAYDTTERRARPTENGGHPLPLTDLV
jgi:hypothetical protein